MPQAGARSMKTVWIYVDTRKQVGDVTISRCLQTRTLPMSGSW
jgi:hypothetical protein